MKITTGTILKLIGKIGDILSTNGILDANGDFVAPVSVQAIAKAAEDIEQLLVSEGVAVAGNVDKVIQAIPLVLALIGVK